MTKNNYQAFRDMQQNEFNSFPVHFAFGPDQFRAELEKMGLTEKDKDQLIGTGGGGFMLKTDYKKYIELINKLDRELKEQINTNDIFAYDMFFYELANHEYIITWDAADALEAVGLSIAELNADKRLLKIFNAAKKAYLKDADNN